MSVNLFGDLGLDEESEEVMEARQEAMYDWMDGMDEFEREAEKQIEHDVDEAAYTAVMWYLEGRIEYLTIAEHVYDNFEQYAEDDKFIAAVYAAAEVYLAEIRDSF